MHTSQRIAMMAGALLLAAVVRETRGDSERVTGEVRLEDPAIRRALESLTRPKGLGIIQNRFGDLKSCLPGDFCKPCEDEMDLLVKTGARVDNELLRRARLDKRLRVRFRAACILAERGNERVIPILLEMTASANADERYLGWHTYELALGRLPLPRDISAALIRYRQERDAEVREQIEYFFAKTRNAAAVKPLLQRVRKDPNATMAVLALGVLGDPAAVPVIIKAYKDHSDPNDHIYIGALGKLATPEAVDFLIEHLDNVWVPEALAETKSAKALPALRSHLKKLEAKPSKDDEGVLTNTRIAIVRLNHKDPREPLLALEENRKETARIRSDALFTLWRSYGTRHLEARILSLYKSEQDHEVKWACFRCLEDSELAGVTDAIAEHVLGEEAWKGSSLLVDALNKRLGTSFRDLEALQSHIRAMKKR